MTEQIAASTNTSLLKAVQQEFTISHPIWDGYTNFTRYRKSKATVLGTGRILDLLINVLLPATNAYATVTGNIEMQKLTQDAWLKLPMAQNNSILSIATKKWFLSGEALNKANSNAATQQGILHVYKNYCESNQSDCNSCLIINSIN